MATLAQMPVASMIIAVAANPGLLRNWRRAKRVSCARFSRSGKVRRSRHASLAGAMPPSVRIASRRASPTVMPARTLSSMCNCRLASISLLISCAEREKAPNSRKKKERKCFMLSLLGEEAGKNRRRLFPISGGPSDLPAAGTRETVVLGLAIVFRDAPPRDDRAFLLQPQQSRIQRAAIEQQPIA